MSGPLMLDLDGPDLTDQETNILSHQSLAGVILFARNYQSPAQLTTLCQSIKSINPDLLIAVDQEGGRVQRFREAFTVIPPMQKFLPLYRKNATPALALLKDTAWLMASELLSVGVDFSFAPVLDSDDSTCPAIGDRAFSPRPSEVAELAGAWIEGMHEAGMATVGKHFPGHGQVAVDSHEALPEDKRSYEQVDNSDLIPFKSLHPQLDAMMPAHILFPAIDQQPVGFSSVWLKQILRGSLGFNGLIFSDDLTMGGAEIVGDFADRAKAALHAGCDVILACNHRTGALQILNYLESHSIHNMDFSSMKASKTLQYDDLRSDPRWIKTSNVLKAFFKS